jgi:hypothetical protein
MKESSTPRDHRKRDDAHDEVLPGLPASALPPPLAGALAADLAHLTPVPTRRPVRSLLALLALGLATPVAVRLIVGLRPDWGQLPGGAMAIGAAGWLALFVVPLTLAVLPDRGQVLANHRRAGRAALVSIAVAIGLVVIAPVGPETDVLPGGVADNLPLAWHCARSALTMALPLVVLVAWSLRRLLPVGSGRIGAAVGAAGAALGGLSLHLGCGYGGLHHLLMGHAGGFLLGVLAGGIIVAAVARRA